MPVNSLFKDHAGTYAAWSVKNPINNDYDRPTILRLAGHLTGKAVLELGCAAGGLTTQLVGAGADVLGVDVEPQMIEFASQKLGDKARFKLVDLDQPAQIAPTASVDIVVASLVLHYIKDWRPLLMELHRCLKPGGVLVFSLHHPITAWLLSDRSDYHRTELVTEAWDWGGVPVTAQSYRRPLSAIFGELRRAGFAIDAVEEPQIQPGPHIDAELMRSLKTQPFFLYIRALRE
ncbi:class I SAM-dependent methyltransferase [Mycobacterium intracellulare]|uniref:class I SAM-dependent methyltransferase n=1 Tax=Mycobacterium intracellulare TaxID=1767 RepID=UPI0006CA815E|nr:class I SAM-dependent methyltransferase [Mycobacterium intracellulare]KPN46602.1 SAM-dependent methyltransferase [Mycobacterium intracellulare subsp. chimaera]